jgi:hypothetical protein
VVVKVPDQPEDQIPEVAIKILPSIKNTTKFVKIQFNSYQICGKTIEIE